MMALGRSACVVVALLTGGCSLGLDYSGVGFCAERSCAAMDDGGIGHDADATTYRDAILATPGLVAYWRLGDAAGSSTAIDAMDLNPGDYLGDPSLEVTGLVANDADPAVGFDGLDDRIYVPASSSLVAPPPMLIRCPSASTTWPWSGESNTTASPSHDTFAAGHATSHRWPAPGTSTNTHFSVIRSTPSSSASCPDSDPSCSANGPGSPIDRASGSSPHAVPARPRASAAASRAAPRLDVVTRSSVPPRGTLIAWRAAWRRRS